MRIWTFIKLLAALAVLGIMGFTGRLAYHIAVKPQGGIFAKIVPNPADVVAHGSDTETSKLLESSGAEMPDVEPGEKAYQKAVELVAMGNIVEAREKLENVVTVYPTSASASEARRIVGEINLDEVLSPDFKEGKQSYVVKKGDSYMKIAHETHSSLDCIMMLNGLTDFGGLRPGEDLIVMPLDFHILIEPVKKSLSLWQGGKFVKDYPIVVRSQIPAQTTTIASKAAILDAKRLVPGNKGYRQSEKIIYLKTKLEIHPLAHGDAAALSRGIYLKPSDMEELNLLTRDGNEVEIRSATR